MAKKLLSANKIVKKTISKRRLFNGAKFYLLMVSGGSDSVALAYIMNELAPKKFAIMHLNHNLRPDSKEDAEFVEALAKHFGVKYFGYSEHVREAAEALHKNIEDMGRTLRYTCANAALNQLPNNTKIVTAHTADDRIENFYMRSIVGTGPGGFASMSYQNENIIRPLLDCSKESLIEYLESINKPFKDKDGKLWHEDSTNEDTNYFRAYVRHEIIPLAKRQNPQIINNLTNSMNLIADESAYIEKQVDEITNKHISFKDKSFMISPDFKSEDLVLKRRAIYNALIKVFPKGTRIETKSITSILESTEQSNYTDNIQENYSVHSNKNGSLIQPMDDYRKSRNRL